MDQQTRRDQHGNKKRKHLGLKITLTIVALLVIGVGAVFGMMWHQTQSTFNKIYDNNGAKHDTTIKQKKPFSILLLGADTGADGRISRGNSDTIMVVTINPNTHKTLVYSVARDTMAEMVGTKSLNVQKLNAAYNIGESKMAKASVKKLVNVPINYYAAINMGGLEKIVDAVDGITITTSIDVTFDGTTITKGKHHLNGKQALAYSRMRYQDPRGDYGRQLRQQQVMMAVLKKLATPSGITKYNTLMKELEPYLRTDITLDDAVKLATDYRGNLDNVTSKQLEEKSATINGSSYQVPSTETLQSVSDELRTQLGLSKETLSNQNTRLNKLNAAFFNDDNSTSYDTDGAVTQYYTNTTY
ncbi:LCP family glycopolymer transferase [Loigolactobacillus jiayinensis]|uniref:LCP family protein n=1 Tax=Loigolactobacillus jiayinensis TaxID=2486016 RepID=A0ABW1RCK3_9LACO|nr:LCP family protein [Loigolactobacillus jiayinensis]